MKGIVFTEFVDMVDQQFGMEITEAMLDSVELASGGAYTQVGDYHHGEMVDLVVALAKQVDLPVEQLLIAYGRALFDRLVTIHKIDIYRFSDSFDFLQQVENNIHKQVRKLYDNANPPTFEFDEVNGNTMVMRYHSHRGFGAVAEGLILRCIERYEEQTKLTRIPLNEQGTEVRFVLERS
ncbi:heme NO-binding domain-containing protein [Ferrimonas senticii]|uniref:heme NO-binding domain-containing protein n=1 Tax=Ferrimonas senticii TaxID=394566 RepID=UPI0004107227|nr:heme NO-binding domain-containing protein [Ferrimonas senticii]